MTTIVDYGAGNLRSVRNTLEAIGAGYEVVNRPGDVERASRIILPGVGHFGQMMRSLDELGLRQPLRERIGSGIPFLGICVGLQCLFERSEESPGSVGLGILPGVVRKFSGADIRVPHMGWNSLELRRPSRLLEGLGPAPFTYFAHSYFAPVIPATAAACTYVQPYSAVIEEGNLYAVQFHPEKSGETGLNVIRNFLAI
jgi:imidazole glycerol phosphate synthase glutamine amidotransferase subunit